MNARILQQPFDHHGRLWRLGDELGRELLSGDFNHAYIFSAYVTSSGTARICPALANIVRNGGAAQALIGVNNGLTSIQAVADLHSFGVEVWGLHTGGSVLFHPKVYLLRGQHRAWISVGSSNLTGDGMYRNIETNSVVELDLRIPEELAVADDVVAWLRRFHAAHPQNIIRITPQSVSGLASSGFLADELDTARHTRTRPGGGRRRTRQPDANAPPPFAVPALPAATGQRPVRRPSRRGEPEREEVSVPSPTPQTRFFAMTLSAHDASKRTGMPGTPELSLPRPATSFFPPMSRSGRQFPDAYFDIHLNSNQQARTVEYRIWERPAGVATGHADLRINIKHETVDLTTPGGGDIILFEATPGVADPSYDVWIVPPTDPSYASLLQRCSHTVAARGAGAMKRYGFF